jgi:chromosome segregation ATPase
MAEKREKDREPSEEEKEIELKRRFSFLPKTEYNKVRDLNDEYLMKKSVGELRDEFGISENSATKLFNHFTQKRKHEEEQEKKISELSRWNGELNTKYLELNEKKGKLVTALVATGIGAVMLLVTTIGIPLYTANTKNKEITNLATQIQTMKREREILKTEYKGKISGLEKEISGLECVNKDLDSKYKRAILEEQKLRVKYKQVESERDKLKGIINEVKEKIKAY